MALGYSFLGSTRQYDATRSGAPMSDRMMRNLLYSRALAERDTSLRSQQLGMEQQRLDMAQRAYNDQAAAAKIGGATQLLGLPMQGYMSYKMLQNSGLLGGAKTAGAVGGGAQQAVTGAIPGAAQAIPGVHTAVSAPYAPVFGADAEAVAGSIWGGASPTAGAMGATSFLGPAAAGFAGGALLAKPLDQILPGGGKTGRAIGGAAGGAIAGAAVGGPVGAVVGGIIGGISSLF